MKLDESLEVLVAQHQCQNGDQEGRSEPPPPHQILEHLQREGDRHGGRRRKKNEGAALGKSPALQAFGGEALLVFEICLCHASSLLNPLAVVTEIERNPEPQAREVVY